MKLFRLPIVFLTVLLLILIFLFVFRLSQRFPGLVAEVTQTLVAQLQNGYRAGTQTATMQIALNASNTADSFSTATSAKQTSVADTQTAVLMIGQDNATKTAVADSLTQTAYANVTSTHIAETQQFFGHLSQTPPTLTPSLTPTFTFTPTWTFTPTSTPTITLTPSLTPLPSCDVTLDRGDTPLFQGLSTSAPSIILAANSPLRLVTYIENSDLAYVTANGQYYWADKNRLNVGKTCTNVITLPLGQAYVNNLRDRQPSFPGSMIFGDTFTNYSPDWTVTPNTVKAEINNGEYQVSAINGDKNSPENLVTIKNNSTDGSRATQDTLVTASFLLASTDSDGYFAIRFRVSDDEKSYYELRWLPAFACSVQLWQSTNGNAAQQAERKNAVPSPCVSSTTKETFIEMSFVQNMLKVTINGTANAFSTTFLQDLNNSTKGGIRLVVYKSNLTLRRTAAVGR
jgi:hypothetical protein